MIIFLVIIVIIGLAFFYNSYYSNKETPEDSCNVLGCASGTKYVGSINSDKYYSCNCRYVQQINSENIICFESDDDAISQDYIKLDC